MPLRPPAGFISAFFDPLNNPNAPTIGTATGDDQSASVTFTAPANVGGSAISSYSALSTPGGVVASAASSPISVTGLSNGTAYTFAVWATNTYGPSAYSAASNSVTPDTLQRGVFAGGDTLTNTIDYINIASTGNSTDFGDLLNAVRGAGGCASATRGIIAAGDTGGAFPINVIQYITIASPGNAIDFGDIAAGGMYQMGTCSSSTRGLFAGGLGTGNYSARININYITIATTGNTTNFGDLSATRRLLAACASSTLGVFGGGQTGGGTNINIIEYVTIASTGNATDFGDLTVARSNLESCSNSTRGLFAGGDTSGGGSNVVDYITIASAGNAIDFGDLLSDSAPQYTNGACASTVRGVFTGGGGAERKNLGYVTIASTGNATYFGDLSANKYYYAGLSNCHGGL